MITAAVKAKLRQRGYSPEDISHLTPQQAVDIIEGRAGPSPGFSSNAATDE
jgi:hypothetical protein